jgi:hypothetical protein
MILFLLFPDSYERIATGRHKHTIIDSLNSFAQESIVRDGDSPGVIGDKTLFSIRKGLERQHPNQEIDFYRPPVEEMWRKPDDQADEDTEGPDDNEKPRAESDARPRIWIEKTLVKGRTDREQGEHRLGAALWSPQKAKNGADIYKDMRAVREGDVVLHLIDNRQFSGVSVAAGWCQEFRVNGLRFFVFESFFVPVKQPVAGAVGMWESRVFCGIPKEMWKA